jgi:DNA modification methylase
LRDYGCAGQIGLEPTPEAYVEKLVAVFREVRRVLRDDGVLWLNLGDSYTGGANSGGANQNDGGLLYRGSGLPNKRGNGLKPKDLIGIPWRVAFALQADGWYLRSDIIWHKPNPMPESVTDRPTKSHEYIFLMSKSAKYYYDAEAVAEPLQPSSIERNKTGWNGNTERCYVSGPQNHMNKYLGSDAAKEAATRNKRSVWTVATRPYKEAHFATFPPDLIVPCIKAGSGNGDIVLDPFGGSMTTAYIAKELNRKAIMIELNNKYIDMGIKRLAQGVLPLETPRAQNRTLPLDNQCEIVENKA